jgi:phage terminase large subunit
MTDGRFGPVGYNPKNKVHVIYDLGWNDQMSLILVQKAGPGALVVLDYIEDNFKTLDHYVNLLKQMPYNWGKDWLPHDGNTRDFKTGLSTAEILKKYGRKVGQVPQIGIEPGIKMARMVLGRCWFNKAKTDRLIECLKRYRRSVPTTTGEPGSPVHDEHSHGADAFRYLAVVAEQLSNEDDAMAMPRVRSYQQSTTSMGPLG